MITISVSHAQEDIGRAEHIYKELEANSCATWHEPTQLTMESILYPGITERTSAWS